MNSSIIFRHPTLTLALRGFWCKNRYSTNIPQPTEIDLTTVDESPKYAEDIIEFTAEELSEKRLKSRLDPSDRNRLFGKRPYDEDLTWFHTSILYKQRMLGRHGMEALNVPAGALWPTESEIEDKILMEKLMYPKDLRECWSEIAERNHARAEAVRRREEDVEMKLAKVDGWRKALDDKLAKKEANLQRIREEKERLVEEVRRHFGFKIDPRDERFQEMLAKKENEAKKIKKAAKKQEHAKKLMARLLEQSKETVEPVSPQPEAEKTKIE